LSEVNSDIGKGRAWIRRALNHRLFISAINALVRNVEATRYLNFNRLKSCMCLYSYRLCYEDHALLNHPEDCSIFLSLIVMLDTMSFYVSFNEGSLDGPPSSGRLYLLVNSIIVFKFYFTSTRNSPKAPAKKKKKVVKRVASIATIEHNENSPVTSPVYLMLLIFHFSVV
jgi:hypothetical protein